MGENLRSIKGRKNGGTKGGRVKGRGMGIYGRISKILVVVLVVVLLLWMILPNLIIYAAEGNRSLLGTNESLGSPLLYKNFSVESWNRWEMVVWGIFLSNFTVPLIDDYESAFSSSSNHGSKGMGYKALQFGTGSDAINKEIIDNLLGYAITQQTSGKLKEIYVSFNEISRNGVVKRQVDGENAENVDIDINSMRPAKFKDLFLMSNEKDGDFWVSLETARFKKWVMWPAKIGDGYNDILTINAGVLPTFYVRYGSGVEKVLDYTDAWDIQIITAWLARIATSEFKDEFKNTFNEMWENGDNLGLYLDCFGNIVVQYQGSRRIVIPACVNQYLTQTPKINLLNSMIFNGYVSGLSGSELAIRAQQSRTGINWLGYLRNIFGIDLTSVQYGGLPAFGSHVADVPQGTILLFYDLDTIMYHTYFNGGYAQNGQKTVMPPDELANTENYNGEQVYKVHYGKAVKELFDADINSNSTGYMFKIEAANMDDFDFGWFSGKAGEALNNMINISGQIANIVGVNKGAKILSTLVTDNGEQSLFGSPIIIPVGMDVGRDGSKINSAGVARVFMNYLYQAYKNGVVSLAGNIDRDYVEALLTSNSSATMEGFKNAVLGTNDGKLPMILAGFIADSSNLYKVNVDPISLNGLSVRNKNNPFVGIADTTVGNTKVAEILFNRTGTLNEFPGRLVKVYPVSEVLRSVSNVLGIREGTEFGVYIPFIYATYLRWYGVKFSGLNREAVSELNTKIFDDSNDVINVDITSLINVKSEEDKKKSILDYTYMLLHPTEGREYRKELIRNYITNFVYDSYQKIVYGNTSSFYSDVYGDLATRSAGGFLNIDTYAENFMTAWFMKRYVDIAIVIIAVSFILIVIVGLLKGRKFSWFLLSLTVVINTILIVPSTGEITPLVANNYVQNIFKDKMTYWAISEAVTNAKIESDYVNNRYIRTGLISGLSQEEQAKVAELVKSLNIVFLDRALMIKQDISRKVTQAQTSNYADIQRLRSARWLLPMIMRQFTANDGSANYVYVPLGDMYDDMSNMYWYYNFEDAKHSETVNGSQVVDNIGKKMTLNERKFYYPDYVDTTVNVNNLDIPYRSAAYYKGVALEDLPHTYFYILRSSAIPLPIKNLLDKDGKITDEGIEKYVEESIKSGKDKSFLSAALMLEQEAGTYNRFNRNTVRQSYGYLWATESPYHYFYQVVKDSFESDKNLGYIISRIQGRYVEKEDGSEVRTSFMHAGETGYVRDILDLEEMFTNMIPYLYLMQVTAGGTNGRSGVLGDAKISDYEIYRNNYKAWLFRSNWVTKLMESPELTRPTIIGDGQGNKIRIENPLLPSNYPSHRPMIFSEAQMKAYGLHESDLSLVELKCVRVNKDVSMRWTMLLNYANVPGMTKEVFLRQMATEAVLQFNEEFSPKGLTSAAYTLYPNSLDLRAISFDSVMKMLVLNVTRDTSYIYGDTMLNLINNSDIFSAILLLVVAFLSAYVIPFIRNITMGLIFYLGFIAILHSLLSTNRQRLRVSGGYLISNIIFLAITMGYYTIFSTLMAVTSTDAVLIPQSVQVNVGNPVWLFIVILLADIVYIFAMFKMINFCFKNYRDMGMAVYMAMAGLLMDRVGRFIGNIQTKIEGIAGDDVVVDGGFADDIKVESESVVEDEVGGESDSKRSGENKESSDMDEYVIDFGESDYFGEEDYVEIDKEIERGKQMSKNLDNGSGGIDG